MRGGKIVGILTWSFFGGTDRDDRKGRPYAF